MLIEQRLIDLQSHDEESVMQEYIRELERVEEAVDIHENNLYNLFGDE